MGARPHARRFEVSTNETLDPEPEVSLDYAAGELSAAHLRIARLHRSMGHPLERRGPDVFSLAPEPEHLEADSTDPD